MVTVYCVFISKIFSFSPSKILLSVDGLRCGWPKSILFASNKCKIANKAQLSFGWFHIPLLELYYVWQRISTIKHIINFNGKLSMNVCKQNNNHFGLILIEFLSKIRICTFVSNIFERWAYKDVSWHSTDVWNAKIVITI